ncbi:hypothetical protein HXX76_014179 [Chlamydomonas incerta]|uniref:Uncharacterized protein n=1 Tax=Chlamydomonas incerta TaxID=51695 RepID=A0A835VTS0_CHLIN|nr:hypothetical protein HXX76_014179 [Chlamydomonas incerta]|eukprot:KAG2425021.1 hypothetical protein HXX76_014179 [Chlamydomonas incerta]
MPMLRLLRLCMVQTAPVVAGTIPLACEFVIAALQHFARGTGDGRTPFEVVVELNNCFAATTLLSQLTGTAEAAEERVVPVLRLVLHKPHMDGDYRLDTLTSLAELQQVRIASLVTSFPSPAIATSVPCDHLSIFINPNVFANSLTLGLQQLASTSCSLVCNNIRAYTLELPVLPPSINTVVFANTSIQLSHGSWFHAERLRESHITTIDFVNHRMPLLRENLQHALTVLRSLKQSVRVGVPALLAHQVMDVLVSQASPHTTFEFLHNGTLVEFAMALLASKIMEKYSRFKGMVLARFMDFYGDVESPALADLRTGNTDMLLELIEPSLAWMWGLLLSAP